MEFQVFSDCKCNREVAYTLAEIEIWRSAARREATKILRTDCCGNIRWLDGILSRRDIFQPKNLEEINPRMLNDFWRDLSIAHQKSFVERARKRPIQHKFWIEFPANSRFYFQLIVNLAKEKAEIIRPFRETIDFWRN